MRNISVYIISLLILTVSILATGCTKTIGFKYQSDMQRMSNAEKLERITMGVAKFEDKRSWALIGGEKAESFIAQQGPWKFGLTYEGQEFVPVKDIVQTLFVSEFGKAGIQAKSVDRVLCKASKQDMRAAGEKNGLQYILGGEIHVFEFVNEEGVWTVSSRRSVTLSLILLNIKNETLALDTTFSESQRENEGMGVLHSTNVNKLMNGVFKKVVKQVVEEIAAKMAVNADDIRVLVACGKGAYEFMLDNDRFVLVGSLLSLPVRS